MANVDLLVSVSEEYLSRMPDVIQKLEAAGMTDVQSMETVGIITGSLEDSKIAEISGIEGVALVERSQSVQLPPSDSDIQ